MYEDGRKRERESQETKDVGNLLGNRRVIILCVKGIP
jgi:hypothetical protein